MQQVSSYDFTDRCACRGWSRELRRYQGNGCPHGELSRLSWWHFFPLIKVYIFPSHATFKTTVWGFFLCCIVCSFYCCVCDSQGDLSELGKILMQGSFSVWTGHRKGPTKMKDLARFKPMQRHLFLYEKALVFCKKREDHSDGYEKTSSYSFKHFLKVRKVLKFSTSILIELRG